MLLMACTSKDKVLLNYGILTLAVAITCAGTR